MRTKRLTLCGLIALAVFSPAAHAADELTLSNMIVKQKLKAGRPYDVALRYEGDASGAKEVCFSWSGEGPYCWKDFRVDKKAKLVRTKAQTGNPNKYTLSGFVRYGDGQQTNAVSASIDVRK